MFILYLFFVLLLNGVLSDGPDECVRYYFEDYDDLFTTASCSMNEPLWHQGSYDNSTIAAPNEKSKWFIEPSPTGGWSCTCSFPFTIMPDALVEANLYFETNASDVVFIDLMQITETGTHRLLGWDYVTATTGWRVIRVTNTSELTGNPPFQGYVRFLASEGSVTIVDSFRYVPLSMDPEEECVLYEDTLYTTIDSPSTTTDSPSTTTDSPKTTTDSPSTTTMSTDTLTTTDPATTPDTTSTTTPATPVTTPKNSTNYIVEELFDFRKSIRISKKRITKVVDGVEQSPLGLE